MLEHHAASGLLEVDDPAADALARRYRLLSAYVPVLADPDDVRYRAFNGVEIVRAARWLAPLAEAFRTGDAPPPLPWAPEGRAEYNRPAFLNLLGTRWLPAIADVFTAPASDRERYHYGWSVVSCLPSAMGDPGTAATGAVMRPATLGRYAREAGFRSVEVLPLQTQTWRFYRLVP